MRLPPIPRPSTWIVSTWMLGASWLTTLPPLRTCLPSPTFSTAVPLCRVPLLCQLLSVSYQNDRLSNMSPAGGKRLRAAMLNLVDTQDDHPSIALLCSKKAGDLGTPIAAWRRAVQAASTDAKVADRLSGVAHQERSPRRSTPRPAASTVSKPAPPTQPCANDFRNGWLDANTPLNSDRQHLIHRSGAISSARRCRRRRSWRPCARPRWSSRCPLAVSGA